MALGDIFKNIVTLGGAYREKCAEEKLSAEKERYQVLHSDIRLANRSINKCIKRLRSKFTRTKRRLKKANKILQPYGLEDGFRGGFLWGRSSHCGTSIILKNDQRNIVTNDGHSYPLAGVVAGTSAAIVAWQGVQILGIASTGTAIAGLSGAAASNAGWAAFGGGSLATGGGGMALGHLVLPGIGIAICVTISAISSHSHANRIYKEANEYERVNYRNGLLLRQLTADDDRLFFAERYFTSQDEDLKAAIQTACRKLRRFGWASDFARYLRYRRTGNHYVAAEEPHVLELKAAVDQFMNRFNCQ